MHRGLFHAWSFSMDYAIHPYHADRYRLHLQDAHSVAVFANVVECAPNGCFGHSRFSPDLWAQMLRLPCASRVAHADIQGDTSTLLPFMPFSI